MLLPISSTSSASRVIVNHEIMFTKIELLVIEEVSVVLIVNDVYVIVTVCLDVPVAELVLVLVLFNMAWAL